MSLSSTAKSMEYKDEMVDGDSDKSTFMGVRGHRMGKMNLLS